MGKYEPLPQFLSAKSGTAHRLSFEQIERVLGFKLPQSAYEHEAWWSNSPTGHSHSRAWLAAGWRTQDVDLGARKVTFRRSAFRPTAPKKTPKRDPWGCMAGTITVMPDADLTAPSGESWNALEGRFLNE
jgi:hypothetical protein